MELLHTSVRKAYEIAIDGTLKFINKDREKNLLKLVDISEKFMGNTFQKSTYEATRRMIQNPDEKWMKYLNRALDELNPHVIKMNALNLGFEAAFRGYKKTLEMEKIHQCNIPWIILMDPTSACNLHCTGCWAAEYGHQLNLSLDDIDSIIRQGKELGTYMYIYTGGEPLTRKKDVIKICEMHPDCAFLSFTNGTLIDEEFCQDMLRVKNFVPAISLEGFETANDSRRGEGCYENVKRSMELLKKHKLPFGISTCYTSVNYKDIASDEFFDLMIDSGALFCWFFHYMPVGNEAVKELLPTPEQRAYVYHQIRKFRSEKPIFTMDFQNDAQYVGGCIAGGRRYLHINAKGDVEPCVFIHYSNCNIHNTTLLDALRSPLFQAYHDNQPFNENMLRPCPMLENAGRIQELVKQSKAVNTDYESPEDVDHLLEKTVPYAKNWKPMADKLWNEQKK